nr:MAG TPA: hypothetical protein [Caudoviricetes sp.]
MLLHLAEAFKLIPLGSGNTIILAYRLVERVSQVNPII